jgi:MutS domain V
MDFVTPFVVVAGVSTLIGKLAMAAYQRKVAAIEELRKAYGRGTRSKPFPAYSVSLYHTLLSEADDTWCIDDKTWQDLFMPQVVPLLCHTISNPGAQILYRMLKCPLFEPDDILARSDVADYLHTQDRLRETIWSLLQPLNSQDAALLPNLFLKEMPPRPTLYFAFPLLTVAMIGSLIGAIFQPAMLLTALLLMIINIVVSKIYRDKMEPWIQPMRVCNTLVRQSKKLAQLIKETDTNVPLINETVAPILASPTALTELDATTRWLLFERGSSSEPLMILVEYINMVFLLDVNSFVFGMEAIRKHAKLIRLMFEACGTMDALISIASYRQTLQTWCKPDFAARPRTLAIHDALHPLIVNGVPNSLTLNSTGLLVTGSNMSGKTTFIRTIAINALLAQSISTCLASRYQALPMGIATAIGRSDSLSEGRSFYLDEVDTIGEFLSDAAGDAPCLFVIDEIYRGTNTTERIAASKAVLDWLNDPQRNHLVIVSTHDVELPNLLQTEFDRYHFRESVQEGELIFDYTLRPGLSSTRNAISLLQSRGYPHAVVEDANKTSAVIEAHLVSRYQANVAADDASHKQTSETNRE